ncbi:hypothetical protein CCACVL1_00593, partial [Corchorus capsularis]
GIPVHRRRTVDIQVALSAFLHQQINRVEWKNSLRPQRPVVARVNAALNSEIRRGLVSVVADGFHRAIGEIDSCLAAEWNTKHVQRILIPHHAKAHRTVPHIRRASFCHSVEIHVDHVVQHPHRDPDSAPQLLVIERHTAIWQFHQMSNKVHRTKVAHGDFAVVGVQRDFRAEVGAVHHADMLLRRPNIARVLERDPRMSGLKQQTEHLAPKINSGQPFEVLQRTSIGQSFIMLVARFELRTVQIMQVRNIVRREQRPVCTLVHALHKQVRNPVGRVHVMRTTPIIPGVLAKLQEFLDVEVPRFK